MEFGMPFLLENESVEAAAALAAELGLGFVELNMSFPLCAQERLSPAMLLALREKYGVYFTFHLDEEMAPCTFTAPVRAAWLEAAEKAITLARAVEAPAVNLHWPRGIWVTLPDRIEYLFENYSREYRENTLRFREVCERASGGRVRVCVENTSGWKPFQQESVELLLASPVFGLTLDTGHDRCCGHCDAPFYARHADRLSHMHLHDATASQDHMPLGAGELDIDALIRRAEAACGRALVEIKTAAALRQSKEFLARHGWMKG
ncbi:MAG: TIM barrel protein [Clostridia bacterium]|nr:TIM barrel protein [Clostridia bacterium]